MDEDGRAVAVGEGARRLQGLRGGEVRRVRRHGGGDEGVTGPALQERSA